MNTLGKLADIVQQLNDKITPDTCSSLLEEVHGLGKEYSEDPEITSLVKMMQSLAKYIQSRLDKAHPDALPVMESIIEAVGDLSGQSGAVISDRQEVVTNQMGRYRLLQNKLSSKPTVQPSEIENLEAVILAIDWEISDETLNNFDAELAKQMERFKGYNIHHTFLKMLNITGRYVAAQKAKAHADSIFFLRSVFKSFEKLILSPDMPLSEKKQILEADIQKFNSFKEKIAGQPEPQESSTESEADNEMADSMAPALSHVKSSSPDAETDDDAGVLFSLDEDSGPESQAVPVAPAAEQIQDESRDVMGDLFTVKESPADELLDAIHLMDVHGSNPDQALNMLDAAESSQSEGMKKFTPEKIDNAPIPEIDSRLDEFFNLGEPASTPEIPADEPVMTETIQEDLTDEIDEEGEIVPFDEADESLEVNAPGDDIPVEDSGQILERLKENFQQLNLEAALTEDSPIKQDILKLKQTWLLDSEKTALIEIIESALILIGAPSSDKTSSGEVLPDETPPDEDVPLEEKPSVQKGFWQKIRSIFSS